MSSLGEASQQLIVNPQVPVLCQLQVCACSAAARGVECRVRASPCAWLGGAGAQKGFFDFASLTWKKPSIAPSSSVEISQ